MKLSLLPLPANRPASRAHHSLGTSARVAPITSSSTSAPRSSDEPPMSLPTITGNGFTEELPDHNAGFHVSRLRC